MINENLKLSGQLNIVLKDKNGKVKEERVEKNLVVNKGLAFIISRMEGTAKGVMSHMALGSSSTAEAAGQSDLVSILGSREILDSTTITGTNNEKIVFVSSFEAGDATGAVKEAGIFNSGTAAAGDMLSRTTFAVVNKAADDTMAVTWTITLSAT
jgi:hypothetical protein